MGHHGICRPLVHNLGTGDRPPSRYVEILYEPNARHECIQCINDMVHVEMP